MQAIRNINMIIQNSWCLRLTKSQTRVVLKEMEEYRLIKIVLYHGIKILHLDLSSKKERGCKDVGAKRSGKNNVGKGNY